MNLETTSRQHERGRLRALSAESIALKLLTSMNSLLKEGPSRPSIYKRSNLTTTGLQLRPVVSPRALGLSPKAALATFGLRTSVFCLKVAQLPTLGDSASRIRMMFENGNQLTMRTVRMCENENLKQVVVAIVMTH